MKTKRKTALKKKIKMKIIYEVEMRTGQTYRSIKGVKEFKNKKDALKHIINKKKEYNLILSKIRPDKTGMTTISNTIGIWEKGKGQTLKKVKGKWKTGSNL